jgi:hypothetical protein
MWCWVVNATPRWLEPLSIVLETGWTPMSVRTLTCLKDNADLFTQCGTTVLGMTVLKIEDT